MKRPADPRFRLLLPALAFAFGFSSFAASNLQFQVSIKKGLIETPQTGRLFVVLSHKLLPEPRLAIGQTGPDAPQVLARDVGSFAPGTVAVVDDSAFAFPITRLPSVPADDYFIQAVFDFSRDFRSPNAPGNLCSKAQKLHLDPSLNGAVPLELTRQLPPEASPPDTEEIKFVQIQSRLLSEFHHRPIFLRAGVVLPRDYAQERWRRYPLWVRIGGLGTRYTAVVKLMGQDSAFRRTWLEKTAPRFLLLQLDGTGPYGDPYYINSANNGPYGDALVQELIPLIETQFRAQGTPRSRVLSGASTGGWVALALQIFYPDFFNGAWASCPDPVDFRALELVNIYEDDNAYVNKYGNERPSERTLKGDVRLTMRNEVQVENLLGRGNCYALSGQQWGAWTALFSPRGEDGSPVPLWDPRTGAIHRAVAEQWKKHDLRLILEQNWPSLGPKLRGKLHIAAGEADQYFLNNAVHLLEDFLRHADPPFAGSIVYGPGKGHGWSHLSSREMLDQMQAATGE